MTEPRRAADAPNFSALLRTRAEASRREAGLLTRRIERVSVARLACLALIAVTVAGTIGTSYRHAFAVAVPFTVAAFASLIWRSRYLERLRRRAVGRAVVSEQGAFRADRLWSQITPQPWTWPHDDDERYRIDLDVVGPESLMQLLPGISPAIGAPRMRRWFTTLEADEIVRERQASVRELAGAIELRDEFELSARRMRITEARIAEFIAWGRAPARREPAWLRVTSRVLPLLSLASFAASAVRPEMASLGMLLVSATALFAAAVRPRTRDAMSRVENAAQIADAYAELAGLILHARFDGPPLRALQAKLGGEARASADAAFQRLQRIAAWAEVSLSPMMHAALQALFAWDCQIARAIEQWRANYGALLGDWFSTLAELECLAALGGLAYTNPTWAFPELLAPDPSPCVRARRLGHPLLPDSARISNDVEIGPPGTVLLISGSNMSGKSTLLRAVGLNILLARAGGPVCAEFMSTPQLRLLTSLRIQDSLTDGMSYFMAEAVRLRDIVFAAEAGGADGAPPVIYLIDEILRGTNSEERAVAARFIVARLLTASAIGAITTHDLGIFTVPEIARHAQHAHFAEHFTGGETNERLTFDYRLRPGPATSTNALRLLSLIGLTPM